MKNLKRILSIFGLVLFASRAIAADDVTVTFQKHFIESKLKSAVSDQFKNVIDSIRDNYDPELPDVRVQVPQLQLTRLDANTLRVNAALDAVAQTGNANDVLRSNMSFYFRFGCSGLSLDIPFVMESLAVADIPYPVDDIQAKVNAKISSLERYLSDTLKRELPAPSRVRCPRVEVKPDLSVVMAVDLAPVQCSPGQTKLKSCSYQQWGDGIAYRCDNGYWRVQSRMCESCADSPHPSCPRRPRRGGTQPF